MTYPCLTVAFIVTLVVGLTPMPAAAQATNTPSPRTAWGQPDLGGVWEFKTRTRLERPESLAALRLGADKSLDPHLAAAPPKNHSKHRGFVPDSPALSRIVPHPKTFVRAQGRAASRVFEI